MIKAARAQASGQGAGNMSPSSMPSSSLSVSSPTGPGMPKLTISSSPASGNAAEPGSKHVTTQSAAKSSDAISGAASYLRGRNAYHEFLDATYNLVSNFSTRMLSHSMRSSAER